MAQLVAAQTHAYTTRCRGKFGAGRRACGGRQELVACSRGEARIALPTQVLLRIARALVAKRRLFEPLDNFGRLGATRMPN